MESKHFCVCHSRQACVIGRLSYSQYYFICCSVAWVTWSVSLHSIPKWLWNDWCDLVFDNGPHLISLQLLFLPRKLDWSYFICQLLESSLSAHISRSPRGKSCHPLYFFPLSRLARLTAFSSEFCGFGQRTIGHVLASAVAEKRCIFAGSRWNAVGYGGR